MIRVYLTNVAPTVITNGGFSRHFERLIVDDKVPGVYYVELKDLEFPECNKLPDVFLPEYVSKITYRGCLPPNVFRVNGEYRLKNAVGVIDACPTSRSFRIEATNMADAAELYTLMMTGQIYPDIPYNQPQVPPPAVHLRQLLREVWQVIERDVRQWCRRRMS